MPNPTRFLNHPTPHLFSTGIGGIGKTAVALALSLGLGVLPAVADDDCDAPINRWQSREAVRQMAVRKGWQIQRLKIDDGCYELRGTDAQGRSFNAKIDPETLRVLKMKQKNHPEKREHAP